MQRITQLSLEDYLALRFSDRMCTAEGFLGDLVADLRSADYRSVEQLDELLARGQAAAERLDREYHPEERFHRGPFLEAVLDLVEPVLCERKRRDGRNFDEYFEAVECVRTQMSGLAR
ncbi:MAG: hypothetical protein FJ027_10740 [Candidatus Rokubacteria bacterium]|nr:hypothetical protein [Candidatus Rokubacteria bacterium]